MGIQLDKVDLSTGEEGVMHLHMLEGLIILILRMSNKRSLLMRHNL